MTATIQPDQTSKLAENAANDRTVADLPEPLDGETAIERVLRGKGKKLTPSSDDEARQ